MTPATNEPTPHGAGVTLQAAADAFLSSPRCENANTRRAYASVIDKLTAELGGGRELADITDDEIAAALKALWAKAAESTWNRNRAATNAWLSWCRDRRRWPAPAVPARSERRKEHVDATKDLPKAAIERQLSRRDLPLREKTLWRMLYETAARANEILALDIEQLDLDNRRAPIRSKGGEIEWIYWGTGTAHLLPRLLRLPDGSSRRNGPLFLADRKPVPARRPAPRRATSAPTPAGPDSATTAPGSCSSSSPDGTSTSCATPQRPTRRPEGPAATDHGQDPPQIAPHRDALRQPRARGRRRDHRTARPAPTQPLTPRAHVDRQRDPQP
jgi:integrase